MSVDESKGRKVKKNLRNLRERRPQRDVVNPELLRDPLIETKDYIDSPHLSNDALTKYY
jgi:hypothetical protein